MDQVVIQLHTYVRPSDKRLGAIGVRPRFLPGEALVLASS